MDDFLTGPKDFDIYFTSTDDAVSLNIDGSYNLQLKKPLEFANEWEIGIKQIIIKSPFNSELYNIFYTIPDQPDEKPISKLFNLKNLGIPGNENEIVDFVNRTIPNNLKKNLSFTLQKDGFVTMKLKNTQIRFQNSYLTDVLGFTSDQTYPSDYPTLNSQIRANKRMQILSPIFLVQTDITLPGYEMLAMNVFTDTNKFESYKYEKVSYSNILRSYISSINFTIKDINNNILSFNEPFVIKLHFRKSIRF